MRSLFICLSFLFVLVDSNQAFAGPEVFHGSWSGKGTYILDGKISQCSEVNFTFSGSPDSFKFASGNRKCEFHEEEFYPVEMEIRGNELYFGEEKVGSFKGSELTSHYSMPEGGGRVRNWRMFMRRQGNHLMYEESRTMDSESTPLISFSGMLILNQ